MFKHEVIVENPDAPRDVGDKVCGKVLITLSCPKDVTSVEVVFLGFVYTSISSGDNEYSYKEVFFE